VGNVCGVNSVFSGPGGLASRAINFAAKHCLNSFETDEDPWHWRPLDRCREASIVNEGSSQVFSQLLIWLQLDRRRPSPRVRCPDAADEGDAAIKALGEASRNVGCVG
jgi:hypothetical protein